MADVTVTLRKYKNRRLYDMKASRYVAIEEIRRRLVDGEKVVTLEGDDVTAEVLANLIQSDTRKGNQPRLTSDALRRFVRSYCT